MMNKKNKDQLFIILVCLALLIKLSLFVYMECSVPDAKFEGDSQTYIEPGMMMVTRAKFAIINSNGHYMNEIYRTPGYPLFLGILHGIMKIPFWGVVLVQLFLPLLAGFFVYRIAQELGCRFDLLAGAIVMFDLPITLYSQMILTESLFLLFISLFFWLFVRFLRTKSWLFLLTSAFVLAASVYIRPAAYFLGLVLFGYLCFSKYETKMPRRLSQAVCFFVVVYFLIGLWHWRNTTLMDDWNFSSITHATVYSQYATGIFHHYVKCPDPEIAHFSPLGYYLNVASRSFLGLFTNPGSLKYFGSYGLKVAGKVVGYPWLLFWLSGFVAGCVRWKDHPTFPFVLWLIAYFTVATVGGTCLGADARFRVPMMPFIAVISAHGWAWILAEDGLLKSWGWQG